MTGQKRFHLDLKDEKESLFSSFCRPTNFLKVTQKVYLNHNEEDVEQRNTASELSCKYSLEWHNHDDLYQCENVQEAGVFQ